MPLIYPTKYIGCDAPFRSPGGTRKTAHIGFFLLLAIFVVFLGCATTQIPRVAAIPVDEFEPFNSGGHAAISPESVNHSIPDVNILELSSDIKALLDKFVSPVKNPEKRLRALADVLIKRVRYDTKSDKYGTKTAKETFETGTGNCLSFSNLFVATARYVGFKAEYQEIPTPPNWTRNGEVLFFTLHIGAFVDIIEHQEYTIQLSNADGHQVILWTGSRRFMFTPSALGFADPEANPFAARPIPDHRAFAQYYNNVGSMYLAQGDNEEAFRYFVKALQVDPKLNFAWSNLGVIYSRNNQFKAAESAYRQGLSVSRGPDDVTVMTIMGNMAKLYGRNGDKEKHDYYEKEVSAFRERNPYYHYAMAKTAYYDAMYEESIKQFKEAIRRKDDDHLFYYGLALSYYKLGDMKNMEKNMDKAKYYAWDDSKKDYYDRVLEVLTNGAPDGARN